MKRTLIVCISIMMFVWTIGTAPSYAFDDYDLDAILNTGHCEYCDLSGADLSHQDLTGSLLTGTDLRNANLSYSLISHAILEEANLSGAKLIETEFYYNLVDGIDLTGADLTDGIADEGELYSVATLCHTTMPDGHVEDKDC